MVIDRGNLDLSPGSETKVYKVLLGLRGRIHVNISKYNAINLFCLMICCKCLVGISCEEDRERLSLCSSQTWCQEVVRSSDLDSTTATFLGAKFFYKQHSTQKTDV
jgi:hypothetical protein